MPRYQVGSSLPIESYERGPTAYVGDGRSALSDAVRSAWMTNPDLQQVRASLRQLRQYGAQVSRAYAPAGASMRAASRSFVSAYSSIVRSAWHEIA
jgi:hypothetical protein